ncbi:hypothetical protein FPZ43_10800 [Mucilaginibacter pallidiroseus]|uniref:Uncharacterized protein n=1 Tax=Mucilaginibacter pallidiroseus TaxID=2599295 RepID=A0A563UDG2_9SPHI|nr:hypothetical protein [Mucilaginibacter pallidiroseus]TWR29431.1 hypothetical protein FPZ43_10800 [Mucilaginibacter pallidiroseus]
MATTPEEQDDMLQQDDQLEQTENDEQMSQQDIHSNGFDETNEPIGETDETPQAEQAYDAAEPSYTLNLGDDTDPNKE